MSEEEKKAIETFKTVKEYAGDNFLCREHRKMVDIVLNLIEKQQKEIEEFKKEQSINTEIHKRDLKIKDLEETIQCLHNTDEEYISKDKIRELKNKYIGQYMKFYEKIDELLEE